MVDFTTGLTRWVDRSCTSVFSVLYIVCVGFDGKPIVGVRARPSTVIVIAVFAGIIRVVFGQVFLSFELMALFF